MLNNWIDCDKIALVLNRLVYLMNCAFIGWDKSNVNSSGFARNTEFG